MFNKAYHTTNPLKINVPIEKMKKFQSLSKIAFEIIDLILSRPNTMTSDTCKIKIYWFSSPFKFYN